MAEIPVLAVPQVMPRATPAGPERVATPLEAFGAAAAGQSLKEAGQAVQQGADAQLAYAQAFQSLNNKAVADTANSEFDVASRQLSTDWQLNHPGAKGLTPNADGVVPLEKFGQDITQLRTSIAQKYNLSPVANALYDEQSRRLQALVIGNASDYAKNQQHGFLIAASNANIQTLQNQAAARPNDLNFISSIHDQIDQEIVHQQILGVVADTPQAHQLASQEAMSKGLTNVISDLGVHNPMAAADLQAVYEKQGWITPEDKDRLDRTLHAPLVAQIAAQGATTSFATVPGSAKGDLVSAIFGQESSHNPNVGDSAKGAVGIGQITKPFWDTFARPGEDIRNSQDNAAVAARGIQHYEQEFGGDPARVAVAYFSGPGNVAPPGSPTPWKRDASDGRVLTSQYVAGVLGRMGTVAPSADTWFGKIPSAQPGSPITAMEENLPRIQESAQSYGDAMAAKYGIDPSEMREGMQRAIEGEYSRTKFTFDQQQTATAASIYDAVDGGGQGGVPISDLNGLFKIPGMQAAYTSLTPTDQHAINQHISANANAPTYERAQNMQTFMGQASLDPLGFTNTNFNDPSLELRRVDRAALAKEQVRVRDRLQRGGTTDTEKWLHQALSIPAISLNLPKDAAAQSQFVGALTTELENFQAANPGKAPSLNDFNAMSQRLLTKVGSQAQYSAEAAARAQVPEDFRARLRALAAYHGIAEPSEAQVRAAYIANYVGAPLGSAIR